MFVLPEKVRKDTAGYNDSLQRFVDGKVSGARFKGVRVPWGIYSQRHGVSENIYMARVRLPGGVASGGQLKALAEAARKYGKGLLHITDRQDIQVHHVKIEDTGKLLNYLKDYELSPRGGGGNTVRAITSCALSGICDKEAFDVKGYAMGLTDYMLRDDASYTMPRKYKIAFSGCKDDCAHATVNDLGFIAKTDNKKNNGFSVYVAGGLGASSRVGKLLYDFIKPGEVAYIAEAVKRVFHANGNRRDKHHARLRFLVEEMGFDEFKKLLEDELITLKKSGKIKLLEYEFDTLICHESSNPAESGDPRFKEFLKHNVLKQKQPGLHALEVVVELGDITGDELEAIAVVGDDYAGVEFRVNQRQNLVLVNIASDKIKSVYEKLDRLGFAKVYAGTATDVVCCAGASTCNLGICDSKAMASKLIEVLEHSGDAGMLEGVTININGCPNSCGHAPIGSIGVVGLTRRQDGRMVPYYKLCLGGKIEEGKTRLNEAVEAVPSRKAPEAIRDFLKIVAENTGEKTSANDYIESRGIVELRKIIDSYSDVPLYYEDREYYRDWGKTEDFSLAGIGSGECGAGIMEIIESDISEAEENIKTAEEKLDHTTLQNAVLLAARALLVVKGIDPKTPEETFKSFASEIIASGVCNPKFKNVESVYNELSKDVNEERKKELLTFAGQLLADVKESYALIGNSFNFEKRY